MAWTHHAQAIRKNQVRILTKKPGKSRAILQSLRRGKLQTDRGKVSRYSLVSGKVIITSSASQPCLGFVAAT